MWAYSAVNSFSSLKRMNCRRHLWSRTRLFLFVRSWVFWSFSSTYFLTTHRTDQLLSISRKIFSKNILGFRSICFLMILRFLEVLAVNFLPLSGRSHSWSRSCRIVQESVHWATRSKWTISYWRSSSRSTLNIMNIYYCKKDWIIR